MPKELYSAGINLRKNISINCTKDATTKINANAVMLQKPKIKLISSSDATLLTFVVDGMHVLDFGALIGARGVCLRVGNMCATWIHERLGCDGTILISVVSHNTVDDMNTNIEYIKEIVK